MKNFSKEQVNELSKQVEAANEAALAKLDELKAIHENINSLGSLVQNTKDTLSECSKLEGMIMEAYNHIVGVIGEDKAATEEPKKTPKKTTKRASKPVKEEVKETVKEEAEEVSKTTEEVVEEVSEEPTKEVEDTVETKEEAPEEVTEEVAEESTEEEETKPFELRTSHCSLVSEHVFKRQMSEYGIKTKAKKDEAFMFGIEEWFNAWVAEDKEAMKEIGESMIEHLGFEFKEVEKPAEKPNPYPVRKKKALKFARNEEPAEESTEETKVDRNAWRNKVKVKPSDIKATTEQKEDKPVAGRSEKAKSSVMDMIRAARKK